MFPEGIVISGDEGEQVYHQTRGNNSQNDHQNQHHGGESAGEDVGDQQPVAEQTGGDHYDAQPNSGGLFKAVLETGPIQVPDAPLIAGDDGLANLHHAANGSANCDHGNAADDEQQINDHQIAGPAEKLDQGVLETE